jgi:hypothetical protein
MKSGTPKPTADRVVRDIRRKTRKRVHRTSGVRSKSPNETMRYSVGAFSLAE